ncbi:MAG TPA: STAS domain-containing protein [Xanthobacteraceae bacterium]|nr:STAS domain-containing protein [Xanthobacteraceae bacterium]
MSEGLKIAHARSGAVCVVTLTGRIDNSNAKQVSTEVDGLIGAGEKSILLDLAGVIYLTSAAFRALLVATDRAERNAARLALCSITGHVRDLFEMGGLIDSFTILGSRDEALARLA